MNELNFKDRSTRLAIFGVLTLVLAGVLWVKRYFQPHHAQLRAED